MAYLSDTKRLLLTRYVHGGMAAVTNPGDRLVGTRPAGEAAPLSFAQQEFWRRETSTPGIAPLYNECITLRMHGPLHVGALERSLAEIIRRHEVWRTSYQLANNQLIQVVHPAADDFHLPVIDLHALPESEREPQAQRLVRELVGEHFDLRSGPLWRALLIKMGEFEHRLYQAAHLSIVDGVSVYQIFPSELAALYIAFSCGHPSPLPASPARFGDYACWQRQSVHGDYMGKQLAYWRGQLAGELPELRLPGAPHKTEDTGNGSIRAFDVSRAATEAIRNVAQQEGVTLFTALLAAFVTLLHGYTKQDDIIVGTLSPAGRKQSQFQGVMGHFLNPVALRFDLTAYPTFRQLLRRAQRLTLEAISNDDVPIEMVQQELSAKRPLFRVAISLQPPIPHLGLNWSITTMDVESGGTPWDLYIAFIDRPAGMSARVQYNSDFFNFDNIASMWQQFETLLESVSEKSQSRISDFQFQPRASAISEAC